MTVISVAFGLYNGLMDEVTEAIENGLLRCSGLMPKSVRRHFAQSYMSVRWSIISTIVTAAIIGALSQHLSFWLAAWLVCIFLLFRLHITHRAETQWEIERVSGLFESIQSRHALVKFLMSHAVTSFITPEWLISPDTERVQWVNTFIARLFPYVQSSIADRIRHKIDTVFAADHPSITDAITCTECDLGKRPPRIDGIKVFQLDNDTAAAPDNSLFANEIVADIHINWTSTSKIVLDVLLKQGFHVEVTVTDVSIIGVLRIRLYPLVDRLPGFSNISIAFRNKPLFHFHIQALQTKIMNIPALAHYIQDEAMIKLLRKIPTLPEAHIITLDEFKNHDEHVDGSPHSLFHLRILSSDHLHVENKYTLGSERLFLRVTMLPEMPFEHNVQRSKHYRDSIRMKVYTHVDWNIQYRIWLFHPEEIQSFKLEIFHMNRWRKDTSLGHVVVPLYGATTTITEHQLDLLHGHGATIRIMYSVRPLVVLKPTSLRIDSTDKDNIISGTITSPIPREILLLNNVTDIQQEINPLISPTLEERTASFNALVLDTHVSSIYNDAISIANTIPSPNILNIPAQPIGCLIIQLHKILHLSISDYSSIDPYIILTCAGERIITKTRHKELNPIYNITLPMSIYNTETDILFIEVYDYDNINPKHDLLGHIAFSVKYIVEQSKVHLLKRIPGEYKLINGDRAIIYIDFSYRPLASDSDMEETEKRPVLSPQEAEIRRSGDIDTPKYTGINGNNSARNSNSNRLSNGYTSSNNNTPSHTRARSLSTSTSDSTLSSRKR